MAKSALNREPARAQASLELEDNQTDSIAVSKLFSVEARDPHASLARLTSQFIEQNSPQLRMLDCHLERDFDGSEVRLRMTSHNRVGAIPLRSPLTGRFDYGLSVQPRFSWSCLGGLLGEMGWRIAPSPITLPMLPRSTRRVPKWVVSSMVLGRIHALLESMDRRFEMAREELNSPRGTVNWAVYAQSNLPRARFLALPCSFPDLRRDHLLAGAIRFTLIQHRQSLDTQRGQGAFALQLLAWCDELLAKVSYAEPLRPNPLVLDQWRRAPLRSPAFREGIESIGWTVDDRNLAGSSELEGLPWYLPMDAFFEAWIEALAEFVARQTGALLQVGRRQETRHALQWTPSLEGAQSALIPDLCLEWENLTLLIDAKYKRHWEDMAFHDWSSRDDVFREQHRQDLLQALAYANLSRTQSVISCLAYPCHYDLWQSLAQRNRLFHGAQIGDGYRRATVWLMAFPLQGPISKVSEPLVERLRGVLSNASL
ncbi:hypothetical protein WDZ92_23315 [Nostoc sp. NIES-2111]